MSSKGFCPECEGYNRHEQVSEYTLRCAECDSKNDKNDIEHTLIASDEWCGSKSCPRCQGYDHGPEGV